MGRRIRRSDHEHPQSPRRRPLFTPLRPSTGDCRGFDGLFPSEASDVRPVERRSRGSGVGFQDSKVLKSPISDLPPHFGSDYRAPVVKLEVEPLGRASIAGQGAAS